MHVHTLHAVFGWYQNSFIGVEQEVAYKMQAGYQKGASHTNVNLQFDIASWLDTASKLNVIVLVM